MEDEQAFETSRQPDKLKQLQAKLARTLEKGDNEAVLAFLKKKLRNEEADE